MSDESDNPWRALLHSRMRGRPNPMLVMPDALWSAASLWAGTRAWVTAFRTAGLGAGDRLVCALPEGPAFVQVLLACLWDELTFVPVDPEGDGALTMHAVDARAVVAEGRVGAEQGPGVFVPDAASQPPSAPPVIRTSTTRYIPGAAVAFVTTDAVDAPAWTPWSNQALLAAVEREPLQGAEGEVRVLSLTGWRDAFGLAAGLLAPLLQADEIVRDAAAGGDLDGIAQVAAEYAVTHWVLTAPLADRIRAHQACSDLLGAAQGVVVGDAEGRREPGA